MKFIRLTEASRNYAVLLKITEIEVMCNPKDGEGSLIDLKSGGCLRVSEKISDIVRCLQMLAHREPCIEQVVGLVDEKPVYISYADLNRENGL